MPATAAAPLGAAGLEPPTEAAPLGAAGLEGADPVFVEPKGLKGLAGDADFAGSSLTSCASGLSEAAGLEPATAAAPLGAAGLEPDTAAAPLGAAGLEPPTEAAPLGAAGLEVAAGLEGADSVFAEPKGLKGLAASANLS